MTTKIKLTVLSLCFGLISSAQSFEEQIRTIAKQIEHIKTEEKNELKKGIESLDEQLKNKTLTLEEYQTKKIDLANYHAKNIEDRVNTQEKKLRELISQKVDGQVVDSMDEIQIKKDSLIVKYKKPVDYKSETNYNKSSKSNIMHQNYTETGILFAFGINNLIENNNFNSLNDEDFALWESRFYEWGINRKSVLSKKSDWLSLRYGFSFMYNNLRATGNRYFVKNGDQTDLIVHPNELKVSRFRNLNLVFPLHFEFDTSRNKVIQTDEATYYKNSAGIRIGIGSYAGLNLNTKQFTEYFDAEGKRDLEEKNNFNTNKFIYGSSGYVGYKWFSIYMKYDINPLFKNNPIQQNNISMGIRFDFDF